MHPLTAPEIRAAFVNCSQGEAKRAALPDLDLVPWESLDFLGRRSAMCQVCLTPHNGTAVTLTVARKTGPAGKRCDSAGVYLCRDLACSLYGRSLRSSGVPRLRETLPVDQLVARLRANLDAFLARVLV